MAKKKAVEKKTTKKKVAEKTVKAAGDKPRGFAEMKLVVVPAGKKYVAGLKYNGKLVFTSEPMSSEGHAKNFAGRLAEWLKKPAFTNTTISA